MAKTNNNNEAGKREAVRCRNCFWANLFRYDSNPVLAECRQKPDFTNEQHPYDVDVASTPRYCGMHKYQDEAEKTIQQRISVRRHPMAAFVRTNDAERKAA